MVAGVPVEMLVVLVVVAAVAGVGITAVGPGGIFLTVALYALTDLPSATVVGTVSATFVATGLLGSLSYYRSGELGSDGGREAAAVLSVTGLLGALLGVRLNAVVSEAAFGVLLGALVLVTGVLVFYRTRRGVGTRPAGEDATTPGLVLVGVIGGFVGVSGGLLGVGGPVLAVPLLVVVGMPLLLAVGIAQVQSVFIALFTTVGYVTQGAVSWPLALVVGVPELLGVVAGWYVAQSVDSERLTRVLAGMMVGLGPAIVLF
ncbi:sulfite exporter TauE/SafE family protein [Halomarina rubra]|uniref:Probable membrane transporter protein n=1 Tax=Halomarina rubra TaxID=2071873 RepID=A0ABD6AWA3_9EURY|nr:sulfite exporter TauE/SafE family protein [Halomarina rubra]